MPKGYRCQAVEYSPGSALRHATLVRKFMERMSQDRDTYHCSFASSILLETDGYGDCCVANS
jgi:hypothetical protein